MLQVFAIGCGVLTRGVPSRRESPSPARRRSLADDHLAVVGPDPLAQLVAFQQKPLLAVDSAKPNRLAGRPASVNALSSRFAEITTGPPPLQRFLVGVDAAGHPPPLHARVHSAISRARMPVAPATPARSFRRGISHHFPTAPTRPQGSGFHCDIPTATTRRNRARARPESESRPWRIATSRAFAEYHPDRAWRAER